MGVIIVWALLIISIVAVVVWFFCSYINISDEKARKIELYGYILLFAVVFWETFIKNVLFADFYDSNFYIEQKLYALFLMLENILAGSVIETSGIKDLILLKDSEYLKTQLVTIDVIEALLTLGSTVAIAIGRFQEIKNKSDDSDKEVSTPIKQTLKITFDKYGPNSKLYITILLVLVIIMIITVSGTSLSFENILNNLAIGAIASLIVAWMIESADCRKKNRERVEKENLIFSEYKGYSSELCMYVARRAVNLAENAEERTFAQWLYILSDLNKYKCPAPQEMRKRSYLHIVMMVKTIKSSLIVLQQQYAVLVDSNIVDTNDFRKHAKSQSLLCDDICDCLEIHDFSDFAISETNDMIKTLIENVDSFFPGYLPQYYSWKK